MIGVSLEDNVIELGNLLAARPIPELENGCHQPHARHVLRKPILRQQVLGKRCWTQPTVSGGRIFCRNNNGDLAVLAL